MPNKQANKVTCLHDYKNAIRIGNVDYVCPLCVNPLDPFEWFLMNSFEFVDVTSIKEKCLGRSVVTKQNFLRNPERNKRLAK